MNEVLGKTSYQAHLNIIFCDIASRWNVHGVVNGATLQVQGDVTVTVITVSQISRSLQECAQIEPKERNFEIINTWWDIRVLCALQRLFFVGLHTECSWTVGSAHFNPALLSDVAAVEYPEVPHAASTWYGLAQSRYYSDRWTWSPQNVLERLMMKPILDVSCNVLWNLQCCSYRHETLQRTENGSSAAWHKISGI